MWTVGKQPRGASASRNGAGQTRALRAAASAITADKTSDAAAAAAADALAVFILSRAAPDVYARASGAVMRMQRMWRGTRARASLRAVLNRIGAGSAPGAVAAARTASFGIPAASVPA